jgi:hypothetical protein
MTWPLLLQAIASLVAVVALVLLAGRAARLRGLASGADPNVLRLAATLALDSRRRLHLVNAPGGNVLVLSGGANDNMMAWPAPPRDPP